MMSLGKSSAVMMQLASLALRLSCFLLACPVKQRRASKTKLPVTCSALHNLPPPSLHKFTDKGLRQVPLGVGRLEADRLGLSRAGVWHLCSPDDGR